MTTTPVTCPYCNSLVTVTPGTGSEQRIPCQRCGETFTPPAGALAATAIRTEPAEAATATTPDFDAQLRWLRKPVSANRRLALLIVCVMICLFAGALAFALSTESFRRANDKGIVKLNPKRRPPLDDTVPLATDSTPPAQLEALGWLPPETSLVVGVHVREIADNEACKSLLSQPIKAGAFNLNIEILARWSGFKLSEIDHLVLGVRIEDAFPPRIHLVVRTRQDFDEHDLAKRLKAEPAGMAGQRRVQQFHLADTGFKPVVCTVDKHTAVYALFPNQLRDVPAAPQADLAQLPREVRDILKTRLGQVGPLWIAGHADNWDKTALPLLFTKLKKEDRVHLTKVRTFAGWLQLGEPMLVQAAFDCGDDRAAKDLQSYLEIPDLGADPNLGASRAEGWLNVQIRTGVDKARAAIERWLDGAF